ncbi:MAG: hypothetical protein VX938_08395, partial [Myxococcota bacterium]|nr:hypothetical protein [Myxococcota bacterium]
MRRALLIAMFCSVSACATTGDVLRPGDVEQLRGSVSKGDPDASRRLAMLIAEGRLPGASIGEAVSALEPHATESRHRALLAELEVARGEPETGFDHWIKLLVAPDTPSWIRMHAALRALHEVDHVSLTNDHAESVDRALTEGGHASGPVVAQLAVEIGMRLRRAGLMARGQSQLGPVARYRTSTKRVSARPARDLIPSAPTGAEGAVTPMMGSWVETPDGRISLADNGPGLYLLQVPIPERETPWSVEILTAAATAVQLPSGEWIANQRLRQYRPGRYRVQVPPGPSTELNVRVGVRSAGAQVQMWTRPTPPAPQAP